MKQWNNFSFYGILVIFLLIPYTIEVLPSSVVKNSQEQKQKIQNIKKLLLAYEQTKAQTLLSQLKSKVQQLQRQEILPESQIEVKALITKIKSILPQEQSLFYDKDEEAKVIRPIAFIPKKKKKAKQRSFPKISGTAKKQAIFAPLQLKPSISKDNVTQGVKIQEQPIYEPVINQRQASIKLQVYASLLQLEKQVQYFLNQDVRVMQQQAIVNLQTKLIIKQQYLLQKIQFCSKQQKRSLQHNIRRQMIIFKEKIKSLLIRYNQYKQKLQEYVKPKSIEEKRVIKVKFNQEYYQEKYCQFLLLRFKETKRRLKLGVYFFYSNEIQQYLKDLRRELNKCPIKISKRFRNPQKIYVREILQQNKSYSALKVMVPLKANPNQDFNQQFLSKFNNFELQSIAKEVDKKFKITNKLINSYLKLKQILYIIKQNDSYSKDQINQILELKYFLQKFSFQLEGEYKFLYFKLRQYNHMNKDYLIDMVYPVYYQKFLQNLSVHGRIRELLCKQGLFLQMLEEDQYYQRSISEYNQPHMMPDQEYLSRRQPNIQSNFWYIPSSYQQQYSFKSIPPAPSQSNQRRDFGGRRENSLNKYLKSSNIQIKKIAKNIQSRFRRTQQFLLIFQKLLKALRFIRRTQKNKLENMNQAILAANSLFRSQKSLTQQFYNQYESFQHKFNFSSFQQKQMIMIKLQQNLDLRAAIKNVLQRNKDLLQEFERQLNQSANRPQVYSHSKGKSPSLKKQRQSMPSSSVRIPPAPTQPNKNVWYGFTKQKTLYKYLSGSTQERSLATDIETCFSSTNTILLHFQTLLRAFRRIEQQVSQSQKQTALYNISVSMSQLKNYHQQLKRQFKNNYYQLTEQRRLTGERIKMTMLYLQENIDLQYAIGNFLDINRDKLRKYSSKSGGSFTTSTSSRESYYRKPDRKSVSLSYQTGIPAFPDKADPKRDFGKRRQPALDHYKTTSEARSMVRKIQSMFSDSDQYLQLFQQCLGAFRILKNQQRRQQQSYNVKILKRGVKYLQDCDGILKQMLRQKYAQLKRERLSKLQVQMFMIKLQELLDLKEAIRCFFTKQQDRIDKILSNHSRRR